MWNNLYKTNGLIYSKTLYEKKNDRHVTMSTNDRPALNLGQANKKCDEVKNVC